MNAENSRRWGLWMSLRFTFIALSNRISIINAMSSNKSNSCVQLSLTPMDSTCPQRIH